MDIVIRQKNNKKRCLGNFDQKSMECWDSQTYAKDRCEFYWECIFETSEVKEVYIESKGFSVNNKIEFEEYEEEFYKNQLKDLNGDLDMNRFEKNESVIETSKEEMEEHPLNILNEEIRGVDIRKFKSRLNTKKTIMKFDKIEGSLIPISWKNLVDKIMSLEDVQVQHKKTSSVFSTGGKNFVSIHTPSSPEVLRVFLNGSKSYLDNLKEVDDRNIIIPCNKTQMAIVWTKPEDEDYTFDFIKQWYSQVREKYLGK